MQDYQPRPRDYSPYDDILSNGKRSYNFSNMQKSIQLSQTDKRIEQIKRKYDTPNRKDRISQLSAKKYDLNNKENDNYAPSDFKTKITITQTEGNQPGLKQSKAISNSRQSYFNNPSSTSKGYFASGLARQRDSYDSKLTSNKLYTNENEEQFFKRVKEMKQSLLYGDNSTKQTEMKSSTFYPNRQSRSRSGFYDSNQNIEKDRIDNIDKINQKIKGILECLNENQKTRIPSRNDINKRSKADLLGQNDSDLNVRDIGRDIARTPVKNVVTSSIMGRQSFGNHRHERSQILDKIEINRQLKQENMKNEAKKAQDDDRWQKLSSKLEKYQLQNKLRLQKAYDFSKQAEKQPQTSTQNVIQSIRKQRYNAYQNDFKRSTELIRRDNRSMDMRDMRSRSFLAPQTTVKDFRDRSLHSRDLTGTKDYEMKSGKKLDDEIDRIQRKIQQFEQEKKRLNINFKPFNYSNSKSSSNLFMNNTRNDLPKNDYSQRKISDFNRCNTKNEASTNGQPKQSLRQQFDRLESQQTFREKKEYRDLENFHDGSFNRLDSKIEIKIEKSNPSSVRTSKFISHGSSRVSNVEKQEQQESFRLDQDTKKQANDESKSYERSSYKYLVDESLKKQTDEGIEERRKKLMNCENGQIDNTQLKTLVKSLCDQVQLDEQFRNAKLWYQCTNDPRKEDEIRKLLPNKSIEQIRQLLKVRESQNNPFFTTQGYNSSYATLVDLYKRSQVNWNETIYKKYNKNALESQGFTSKDIDLEKKGHINLGDLVRFLNLESGTFYRNRDLSLIFVRIAKFNNSPSFTEVSFQQMIETFCR